MNARRRQQGVAMRRVTAMPNDHAAYVPEAMHERLVSQGVSVVVMSVLGYEANVDRHLCWWPCVDCGHLCVGWFLPEDLLILAGGERVMVH